MAEHVTPSSSELVASMVAAFNQGDLIRVLALGESIADPGDTDDTVLLLLGLAQQSAGRPEAAVATFRKLTERRPHVPEYWNNLGIVARQIHDLETAEHALRTASTLAPGNAETLYNLGLLYTQQQRWLLARETLLQAVELAPDFLEARLQAAHACHFCSDTRGAEVMLEGAADWPPQQADQALILATILSSLGYQATAFRTLTQAVMPEGSSKQAMESRFVALRASMYERSNQIESAEAELSKLPLSMLDTLPTDHRDVHVSGLQVHASLAARLGHAGQAAELYEQLIRHGGDTHMLANAAFGLAAARAKQGHLQEAWKALGKAHAWQLEFANDFVPDLLAEGSQPLDMVTHNVSRIQHDRWTALKAPRTHDSPVFVVGFPRSGTTLLEQMLDAHPDFRSMDERAFIYELIKRMQLAGQTYPADLATLTQPHVNQLRDIYGDMVRRVVPDLGHHRLVDKNPLNMLCLPMIARLYPEARIILCLRHPCDVLLSCFMQPFRSPAFMVLCSSLKRLAEGYVQTFEQWYRHVEVFAPRVLEWRYESVVSRFDDHVVRLGEFLDVDDASPMARFAEHARAKGYISTPSYTQVTEGIHTKAVNRWHAYREHFEPVLPILRPMMERLGYDT
jgi:tetratricopeptide (TPR) repeat protein